MKKVFVSGCFDIIHGGHIKFFEQAKKYGDYLIVSFASDEVLWKHKKRKSALPESHKKYILESLRMVDEVIIGRDLISNSDWQEDFLRIKPDFMIVTEDDKYKEEKTKLCDIIGCKYVMIPKEPFTNDDVSTSKIRNIIKSE